MKLKVIDENASSEASTLARTSFELTIGRYRQAISSVVIRIVGKRCSVSVRLRSGSMVVVDAIEDCESEAVLQVLGRAARHVRRRLLFADALNHAIGPQASRI